MRKSQKTNVDPNQKLITSFFTVHKGPLEIQCNNVITKTENDKLAKLYRRKRKKHAQKGYNVEACDSVEYIKTETESDTILENGKNPISPKIILTTDICCVNYLSSLEYKSSIDLSNIKINESSPLKKQRKEIAVVGELTLTKSQPQIKQIRQEASRTSKMSQSINIKLETSDLKEFSSSIKSPMLLGYTSIEDLLKIEVLEEDVNSCRITDHIKLIDDIIDNTIKSHLSMLLFGNEKNLLESFQQLSIYQKYFSCKLFTHQVKWHNGHKFAEKINLPVTSYEVKQILMCLQQKLIIKSDYSAESTIYLLNLLGADDVKRIHDALRLKAGKKKKLNFVHAILNYINNQTTLHPSISLDKKVRQMIADMLGDVVHISPLFYTAFYKVHLLYSYSNPEFEIPSGLYRRINDMKYGNISHPDFNCENQTIFANNIEFNDFYKAFSYKTEVIQAMEKKGELKFSTAFDLSKEIVMEFTNVLKVTITSIQDKPNYLKRFTAGHQYASTLWILSKHLSGKYPWEVKEWLKMLLEQTQFCQKRRGLWYSHLSMIYKSHLKDYDKAVETLLYALREKGISPVDLAEVVYRARSYCNRKKADTNNLSNELLVWKESVPSPEIYPSTSIKCLANDSTEMTQRGNYKYMGSNGDISYMSVEQIAIRHYIDEEGFLDGIHCEGALMQTIFFTLFWDIICIQDIPYTFICKMQYLPLDFNYEEFYHNRKAEIDKRLTDLQSDWSFEELESHITKSWDCIYKYKSLFVLDYVKDSERLYKIINCIGRTVVSGICQRLAKDFRDHRAGMPDLFVYKENSCKFVEVKGPGDKLSTKQKLWISYLLSIGAGAEVCYVSKTGGN